MDISVEMNFCRRCGHAFKSIKEHVYICEQEHVIFLNSSPAVGVVLFNDKNEVLMLERAIDPGKGMLDIPGGLCDGAETLEDAIARETEEEVGIARTQYSGLRFVASGIDPYGFGGEVLPVTGIIFQAKLPQEVSPVAADDAASAQFMALDDIDLDRVYFPAVRAALAS